MLPVQIRVNIINVTDYNEFVNEGDEMWLDGIKDRIGQGQYKMHEAMLAHIEQIHTNSVKYNTPGNGRHGFAGASKSMPSSAAVALLGYILLQQAAYEAITIDHSTLGTIIRAHPKNEYFQYEVRLCRCS